VSKNFYKVPSNFTRSQKNVFSGIKEIATFKDSLKFPDFLVKVQIATFKEFLEIAKFLKNCKFQKLRKK